MARGSLLVRVCVCVCVCVCVSSHDLVWNVSASLKNKDASRVLTDVQGEAYVGRLHAIMGPSGSGKTTLLNILGGRLPAGQLEVQGEVLASQEISVHRAAYVQQEDLLFPQLTVRETLLTAAALQRRRGQVMSERKHAVEQLIKDLGLKKVEKTAVGDAKTRGISGGEKKRLSIATELLSDTLYVLADEPTTGLDSFQALRVVELLKQLAQTGKVVVASIHQPRARIVELFDDITLLSEGRVMYSGPMNQMDKYFATVGYPCPLRVSGVEYYMGLVSVDYSSPEAEAESKARILTLAKEFQSRQKLPSSTAMVPYTFPSRSHVKILGAKKRRFQRLKIFFNKLKVLLARSFKQSWRDKPLFIARFMSSLFSAFVFGAIYSKMGLSLSNAQDRLGLLQVAAVNCAMSSIIKATTSFVLEKNIVTRERCRGGFPVLGYFISKLLAEAPLSALFPSLFGYITYKLTGLNSSPGRLFKFICVLIAESFAATSLGLTVGSFSSTPDQALAIAPAVMVVFIVFGGLYVVNAPNYLSFVPKVSLIKLAFEGLCVNEFEGMVFEEWGPRGKRLRRTGEEVLESLGFEETGVSSSVRRLLWFACANYALTYALLLLQKPAYEKIAKKASVPEVTATNPSLEENSLTPNPNANTKTSSPIKSKLQAKTIGIAWPFFRGLK